MKKVFRRLVKNRQHRIHARKRFSAGKASIRGSRNLVRDRNIRAGTKPGSSRGKESVKYN